MKTEASADLDTAVWEPAAVPRDLGPRLRLAPSGLVAALTAFRDPLSDATCLGLVLGASVQTVLALEAAS